MKICNDNFIKNFKNMINKCLDFIYPENISCIICDKSIKKTNTYSICKSCFKEMNFIQDGCMKCGKPIIRHSIEKEFSVVIVLIKTFILINQYLVLNTMM